MKQRKSILFLAITLCLCFVTMVSCGLFKPDDQKPDPEPDPQPVSYSITVDEEIQHGSIQCDVSSAKAGETITVTAEAEKNFQLVSITVNGEAIEGYSFVMPEKDVVISATFALAADLTEAVPEGAITIKAQSAGGASATGHITLVFGENGIVFEAHVEDSSIVEKDGVAVLFSRELPIIGGLLKNGQTIKVSVNAKGVASILATDAEGKLQPATLEGVTTSFATWSKNGEKFDGYHVEALIPYAVLGTTAEGARGSVTVCPVVYSAYGSLPAQSTSLEGVYEDAQNSFAVLVDDNTVRDNNFKELSAQLGSYGSLDHGIYWDLSKDYYAADAENYPNREALLTGHDDNDNNLVFYRVSANEMYVKATITATGVTNKNDQWPKFGIMLFDGASKKGVYFYVDAIMSGNNNNTLDNIVGTSLGYNIGSGEWSANWVNAKDSAFDLATKSIVMEMVYQNGWVHMYADGEFVKSVYYGSYNENLHFGIKSFGIDLKVTDYLASDDAEADGWANKKRTAPDAQDIDILFAGDSYMDFWKTRHIGNYMSYTGASYANEGVGRTKVQYWIDKAPEMWILYNPSKIAFHIGVNDIDDAGANPEDVIASLKVMFEKYHEIFPDATIYWNSLIPNTMFASKYADYKVINAAINEYAASLDWLVYIDQTTLFDVNGAARQDVFDDGLHLSVDIGYPIWARTMLTAMGYERNDGTTMGDIDNFAHTGLWTFDGDSAYSYGNADTALWFKNVYGENVYVEAVISIGDLRNAAIELYPKFGLLVRNDHESRWGIIDCHHYPAEHNTNAGLIYRGVEDRGGFTAQGSWQWNDTAIWGGPTNCDFNSVKLAIAKLGNTVYFLVNDVVYCTAPFSGDVVVGYEAFNLETTITNVVSSTDVDIIEQKLGLTCKDAKIDGEVNDNDDIWTEEVLANTHKFGDKGDGRYFTVAAAKGEDGVYFLVNTYSYDNQMSGGQWHQNANIEFRFGNNMDTQQYIYIDGVGFNGVKSSGGISLIAMKSNGNEGDIYHTTFEFFAPYSSFAGYSADSAEIPVHVWGWVWDNNGWHAVFQAPTVSAHGLRFERKISVSGTNAGVSVDVQSIARAGDTVVATVNVAEGQALEYIKINGIAYDVVDGKVTFTMPDGDVNIEVALKGISITSSIVDNSGEGLNATVNCKDATATVGQTIAFTVSDVTAGSKYIVSVNGEVLVAVDGAYSYTVKATDTAVAVKVELDYDLSEAIDGVKGEGYGAPMTIKVEGGKSFNVWARSDAYGVYFYFEAVSATLSTDKDFFWDNNNFEFRLNNAEHGGVNTKGEVYRASKGYYHYEQQENGLYKHVAEVYVNGAKWIPNFNPDNTVLQYAFKTPGEWSWVESGVRNDFNRSDWWRTGHSTPHGGEPIGLGKPNGLPQCIHVTKNGLVHDCERASIDGDLSEYEGKNAVIGLGNDNAKFDFVGYVADDGVYLAITIYQNKLGETRGEWWDCDNLEIKLLGDRAGFSIVEDFLVASAPISDYAMVRNYDETLGKWVTKIELFFAYDFSSAKHVPLQVGINGNGFQGWQSLIWDDTVAYITPDGITYAWRGAGWENTQRQVAEDMAVGAGLTIDGKADESVYDGATSVTYDNVNGAKIVITGRKLSTGIIVLTTVTHTKAPDHVIQGAGDAWWNFLDVEYRMGGNYSTQMATSVFNNGDWDQYCASKAVTVQNDDGTYTTTFETFLAFSTEYGGMDYDGDVQVCVGGVFETGFTWLAGCGPDTPIYANENGFFLK